MNTYSYQNISSNYNQKRNQKEENKYVRGYQPGDYNVFTWYLLTSL